MGHPGATWLLQESAFAVVWDERELPRRIDKWGEE